MKYAFLMFTVFTTIVLLSCTTLEEYEKKYGTAFNAERAKIGLPVLPLDWQISNTGTDQHGFYFIKWSKAYGVDKEYSYFLNKTITFNEDTILYEENEYVGGDTYSTVDGKFNMTLYITYNFINVDNSKYSQNKGWKCFIENKNSYYKSEIGNISLLSADSILKSWNLER